MDEKEDYWRRVMEEPLEEMMTVKSFKGWDYLAKDARPQRWPVFEGETDGNQPKQSGEPAGLAD